MDTLILLLLLWLIRGLTLLLIASVLLPLIPTGKWWIRLWDFPKVQFLGIGLITLILLGMSAQNQQWDNLLTVNAIAVLLCCLWLLRRILPFTFIWPKEVQTAKTSEEPRIKTAIINLMYDNQSHEQAVEKLQHVDDDLLLLIEIDQQVGAEDLMITIAADDE